jgi:hypothetical protein
MAPGRTKTPKTIVDAIDMAMKREPVRVTYEEVDAESTAMVWSAAVRAFAAVDFEDELDVWACASMVYAWMPRVLRFVHNAPKLARYAREIRQKIGSYSTDRLSLDSTRAKDTREILGTMSGLLTSIETGSRRDAETGSSRSVVPMSKFLHFLAPHVFPIFDSYVGKAINLSDHDEKSYMAHVEASHSYLLERKGWPFARSPRQCSKYTDIRELEYALYLRGRPAK